MFSFRLEKIAKIAHNVPVVYGVLPQWGVGRNAAADPAVRPLVCWRPRRLPALIIGVQAITKRKQPLLHSWVICNLFFYIFHSLLLLFCFFQLKHGNVSNFYIFHNIIIEYNYRLLTP
jgi:hypothetical protein